MNIIRFILAAIGLIFVGPESDPQLQARIRALREGLATQRT
jgi:hypothetical protein